MRNILEVIRGKVESAQRLSAMEGEFLFHRDVDLHAVGELADIVRRRINGDAAYYNRNAHLNPTNVCFYRCALCAYSRDDDDRHAYVLAIDDILKRGRDANAAGCTEMHIVSGAHPDKPYQWYLQIIRELHAAFPRLHLKAWTAVEIDWFSKISKRSVKAVLEEMITAGVGSLPGGGAEIFDPEVRTRICARKADARTWLSVHRAAHDLGLKSNASMLYGHIEGIEHRIDHLLQLRQLQDVTGGFQAFVPLKFHPRNTQFQYLSEPSALDDLRTVAVSRLMLDNFAHIKAYWISLGVGTAQTALGYGADDLDGTVAEEKIHHAAGAKTPQSLTVAELRSLIAETGREPVERDSIYRRVKREGVKWSVDGEK
jgi:aminodeoxyfutalosine synthase